MWNFVKLKNNLWVIKALEIKIKITIIWVLEKRDVKIFKRLYYKEKHLSKYIFYTYNW